MRCPDLIPLPSRSRVNAANPVTAQSNLDNSKCRSRAVLTRAVFGIAVSFALLTTPATAQNEELADTKRVYVPIDELDTILNRDKQGVILPQDQFQELIEQAKQSDGAPANLLMSRVDYVARIVGSQLVLDTTVAFEQFAPGWHRLKLTTPGLSIESAKLGDAQPPLGRTGPGVAYLLNNTPGEHTLQLTMSAPLANVGSDLAAAFSLLTCPSATFEIEVPARKQLVVNGSIMERTADADEKSVLRFPVGGQSKLQLRITERARSQKSDALVFMSSAYGVNVAPSEITWQAVTTLQSFGQSVDKFTFTVPRTLEIAAVESTGLESWELSDSEDRKSTEITATYRQPIDGSRRITFRGVMAVPVNQQWALPGLRLANAASEIGKVVVQHPVGTRLIIESMNGVRRTKDQRTRSKIAQASFDIWQPDFDLQLRLQLREREVLTNMSTILDVEENTVRFETLAGIECLNSPLFEVLTSLPIDWEPTSVQLNGLAAQWRTIPREAGRQYLKIAFAEPLQPGSEFKLRINAVQNLTPDDTGNSAFDIPVVTIEDAGVVEGVLLVRSANWLQVTPEELSGLDTTIVPGMKSELPAFRYQDKNFSGSIKVKPRPTRLTAWTQTFTRLDPDRAVTWLDLHLDVQGGGLREVAVKLPESAGERLRFDILQNCKPAVRIREQIAQEVTDGQRTWMLRFDRRVRGSITLGGFLEEDRADDGNAVPEVVIEAADRQYGFITVEASAEQHLTLDIGDAELQTVDPIDLPTSSYRPKERIVAAYQYVRPDFRVTATEERFDRKAVPTAVCQSLNIQTVVGRTGQLRHQAEMTFVAVGVQNLRVSLSEGVNLWSTEIDGEPIEVRRDGQTYLVPLKRTATPDAVRCLQLTYESTVDSLKVLGTLRHTAPEFRVDVAGSEQPIETLSRTWHLLHSADTVFDHSNGLFEPTGDLGETSLLAQIPGFFSLPGRKAAGDKIMAISILLLAVLVPTLCYRRWGGFGVVVVLVLGVPTLLSFSSLVSVTQTARTSAELTGGADAMFIAETTPHPATATSELDFSEDMNSNGLFDEAPKFDEVPQAATLNAIPVPEAAKAQEGRVMTQPIPSRLTGARLSVPVELQVPDSYVSTTFGYQGIGNADQQPDLDISYHGRELNTIAPIAVALFVMLVLWFNRQRSHGFRLLLVVCGLAIPMAIAPLVPALWQIALEGIFLGTLGGIALWVLAWLVCHLKQLPISRKELNAATMLLIVLIPASQTVAQKKPNAAAPQIVVPYDENGQPLASDRVFLPQATFLKLWRQANPEKAFADAPVDGLVSSANYAAKLVRNDDANTAHMEIRGRFVLHNFRDKQISVDLPLSPVAVEKAELDGRTAPLRVRDIPQPAASKPTVTQKRQQAKTQAPRSVLSVVLEKTGASVLDVDFVVPVKLTGPAGRFSLPLAPTASALMNFTVPDEELQVRVNGSSTAWRAGANKDLQFPVSAGGNITIEWQPKDEDSGVDRVIHADVSTKAIVSDAGLHVTSQFKYRVRQGSVSELTFKVPTSAILQQINGEDVGGWQQDDNGDTRTVRVFLRRSVTTNTSIAIQLFARPDITDNATKITIPTAEPTEVTRETGLLGVFSESGIVVRADSVEGGTQLEPKAFQAMHNSQLPAAVWRYRVRPFRATVSAVRPQARLRSLANHAVLIEPRKLRYTSRFDLQPQGAPRARLAVVMPPEFLPLEVYATNIADWYPYKDESGTDLLIVELGSPTIAPVELVVTGTLPREPDAEIASIPTPSMNGATVATSQIAVRIDKSYTAAIENSGEWKSVAPETLDRDVQKLSKASIRFAFRTDQLQPEPIAVRLRTMPATLFGESVSVITLTDTSVEYSLNLKWLVRQSATDRFAFSGPDWLAGKLEIQGGGLREVIESEPADGRVTWTAVLQEPRSTDYFVLGTATFPPTADANLQSPMLQCEPGAATNPIKVQNHYAVVINQSERLITPVDASLKTIEANELQIKIPQQYLDRATQIVSVPKTAPPQWVVTTPERRQGAPATVNLADLRTTVAGDGSFRTKATYTIRNRARQFLPIVLAKDTRLLSVFVKGKPARPVVTERNGRQLHLVALPRTSEADLSFGVEIVVSGRVPNATKAAEFTLTGHEVQLPVPEILSLRDDAEFGVPVAMTVWKVHVPKSWHAAMITGSSNVTEQDESGSDVIRVMSSLKEAVEQSFMLSSSGGSNSQILMRQATAYDNLKQAEQRFITNDSESMQNADVAKELQQLQRNISDLKKQLADQGVEFNQDATRAQISNQDQSIDRSPQDIAKFNQILITGNGAGSFENSEASNEFKLGLRKGQQGDKSSKVDAGKRDAGRRPGRNRSGAKSFDNLNSQIYSPDNTSRPQIQIQGNTIAPNKPGQSNEDDRDESQRNFFGSRPLSGAGGGNGQSFGGGGGGGGGGGNRGGQLGGYGGNQAASGGVLLGARPNPSQAADPFAPLTGNVVLQPLDELGAVVIRGGQLDIDAAEGIVRELEQLEAQSSSQLPSSPQSPTEWTRTGGLSLPIDITSDAEPLNFSKVGGTPRLTLRVRPSDTLRQGYGLIWAIACSVLAFAALATYRKSGTGGLWHFVSLTMMLIGLLGFVFLEGPNAGAAFVTLAIGLVLFAIISTRKRTQLTSRQSAA